MQVDPQDVISILGQRLANEMIRSATMEAYLAKQEQPEADGIPTPPNQPEQSST